MTIPNKRTEVKHKSGGLLECNINHASGNCWLDCSHGAKHKRKPECSGECNQPGASRGHRCVKALLENKTGSFL
jgi:hypothetical protein